MKSHRIARILKVIILVLLACLIFGFLVERLWNWLMPSLFGLRTITYLQALGLLLLSKILLGGFHRHGRRDWHPGWKHRMEERFAGMTPEERERFRAGMRGRRGCYFPGRDKPTEPANL